MRHRWNNHSFTPYSRYYRDLRCTSRQGESGRLRKRNWLCLVIDSGIYPSDASEKECAAQHLARSMDKDLILYDRGYGAFWFYALHLQNNRTRNSKNKLYSLHEPDVDCISKGKAHKRYELGSRVSIATTAKAAFIIGTRSYAGNPYDGHTLEDQLQPVETLVGKKPRLVLLIWAIEVMELRIRGVYQLTKNEV